MMKKTFIILLAVLLASGICAEASFIVRSVKGSVTVTKGKNKVPVTEGMSLSPAETINIPQGAEVSVKNDVTNNIYSSTKSGSFSLSQLMSDAKIDYDKNFKAINDRLKVSGGGADSGKRVYVQPGVVKRSLSEYDPQASGFAVDPKTLSRCVNEWVPEKLPAVLPFADILDRRPDGALSVDLTNKEAFPIYFNVISRDNSGKYALSCLGQPAGSYVLLPRQSIVRRHPDAVPEEARQLLIVANCQFDVDALLEELNSDVKETNDCPLPDFPLYIIEF